MEKNDKYRLVTRSDFDGLVCAMMLKELDLIDDIEFVHPKDMQDGIVEITGRDITTNLPYVDGVYLAFDHHLSETLRIQGKRDNHIIDPDAPSAARVLYNYYGGKEALPEVSEEIMEAVDKGDVIEVSCIRAGFKGYARSLRIVEDTLGMSVATENGRILFNGEEVLRWRGYRFIRIRMLMLRR